MVSIYLPTVYLQFLVGRFISIQLSRPIDNDNSDKVTTDGLFKILEKDCDGPQFHDSINKMRYFIVFLSSLFMAAFLVDIKGYSTGWRKALDYPFITIGISTVIMGTHYYYRKFKDKKINISNDDKYQTSSSPSSSVSP